jgi:hypothetical protein
MPRARSILLGALFVLAVSVGASASAAAAAASEYFICKSKTGGTYENSKCNTTGTTKAFEFEKLVSPAKEKIEGTFGVTKIEGEEAGLKVIFECTKGSFKGQIVSEGASEGTQELKLEECGSPFDVVNHIVEKLTSCTGHPISLSTRDQLVTGNGIGPEYAIKTFSGLILGEVEDTGGSCVLPKHLKVEVPTEASYGMICALPDYTEGKVEHEVSCSSKGDGNLKLAGNKASFTGVEKLKLSSGAAWYAE